MNTELVRDRFVLEVSAGVARRRDFADEVARGLAQEPKRIPCRFLYDERGSRLFERICRLPEYYPTRVEDEILAAHAHDIVAQVSKHGTLVELGSGSARKTRRLIEAWLARSGRLRYVPIDISRSMLEKSALQLIADYPALSVHAIAAEYHDGLRQLASATLGPKLVLWLGSNVGNFSRRGASAFLRRVAAALEPADRLLVGIDRRKSKSVILPAYDDAQKVTERFSLNLLARVNAELGGRFDLAAFRHVARYDEVHGRVEIYLESRIEQEVRIDALERSVRLAAGERIHVEDSYKYSRQEIEDLARSSGMSHERTWSDAAGWFSVDLFARAV
jgi:dimethylhistidine N-methyltransferase